MLQRPQVREVITAKQLHSGHHVFRAQPTMWAMHHAGIRKVVIISSMGGTDKNNFLNMIGNGNILLWKRKAEKYLIDSGLNYTIVHPGGLIDEEVGHQLTGAAARLPFRNDCACCPATHSLRLLTYLRPWHPPPRWQGGKRELILDVDDNLISSGGKYRRIPRADVAAFCVECLSLPEADNRSVRLGKAGRH
jgi:hypothetical protein